MGTQRHINNSACLTANAARFDQKTLHSAAHACGKDLLRLQVIK
jgi:hypothetical protein